MATPFAHASVVIALVTLTAAAQGRPLPHPIDPTPEYAAALANGVRTAKGRPGAAAWTDYARYVIDAELDPELCRVRGHVVMTYVNRSGAPIEDLVIHLRQNLHAPTARRNIEVEVTGGMTIERLMLGSAEAPHWIDGTVLTIQLREQLAAGAEATVEMDFAFKVPAGEAPRMGRDGTDLFFLGYWYPQFAVHDDVDGWVAEQYMGGSEFYMPYADYEVAVTVPAGYLVQATGTLTNADAVLTEKARAALTAAATSDKPVAIVSAADLEAGAITQPGLDSRLTWRFSATNVRDFAISAANCYVWDACRAKVGDRDGDGADDYCLAQTLYRVQARTYLRSARYARHAIEWMSQHIAPYPWPHATVVEGILGGGMEYPMITLCGDVPMPFGLQSLIAHELAHMWFPMQVGSNEKANVWQDEGLVDFCTDLMEASYWKRRRNGIRKATEYRFYASTGSDREPLLTHGDHLLATASYGLIGYTKPAALLHQLAGQFDYDAVLAGLSDYAMAWRYRHPRPLDFFRSMDTSLGHELDWYWSCWWAETWTLDHAIASVEVTATGTEVVVADRGRAFLPAIVSVLYEDSTVAEQVVPIGVWLRGEREAKLTFGPNVIKVVIDPRHTSLDVDLGNNIWKRR